MKEIIFAAFIGFSCFLSEVFNFSKTPQPSIIAYEEMRLSACEAAAKETGMTLEMAQRDLKRMEEDLKRMERAARKK